MATTTDETVNAANADARQEFHRNCARNTFNLCWELMEKAQRTADDDDLMIAASYASFFHWRKVGDVGNHAVGQWQLSRVHALLGVPERAIHHAKRCLSLCQDHGLGGFHIASAYEALARAHAVAGDEHWAKRFHQLGVQALANISEEDDRKIIEADLASIPVI